MKREAGKAMYPSHRWGPFADDPNGQLLDMGVTGEVWDRAVESARLLRLATQAAERRRRMHDRRSGGEG